MKKCTKKVICERIVDYMQDHNITNLSMPNPFPVSWRTINSIKASHKKMMECLLVLQHRGDY